MVEKVGLRDVPQPFQGTLALWMCGLNPRECVGHSKYYRHRKALLGYGYDIGRPYVRDMSERMAELRALLAVVALEGWPNGAKLAA